MEKIHNLVTIIPLQWSRNIMKVFLLLLISFFSVSASSVITKATVHFEKIILGSGCFWGAEKGYESLLGVIDAMSVTVDRD